MPRERQRLDCTLVLEKNQSCAGGGTKLFPQQKEFNETTYIVNKENQFTSIDMKEFKIKMLKTNLKRDGGDGGDMNCI